MIVYLENHHLLCKRVPFTLMPRDGFTLIQYNIISRTLDIAFVINAMNLSGDCIPAPRNRFYWIVIIKLWIRNQTGKPTIFYKGSLRGLN